MRGNKWCDICKKVFLFNSTLEKHMKTHKMQRSQWHHCPHNVCYSKFKSKSDLKCCMKGHDAIDSGKTFPCQQCGYIGKTCKRLANHKHVHKEHRCHYAGCDAVYNHQQLIV